MEKVFSSMEQAWKQWKDGHAISDKVTLGIAKTSFEAGYRACVEDVKAAADKLRN